MKRCNPTLLARAEKAEAEVARLREALAKIANAPPNVVEIAIDALAGIAS